MKGTVRSDAWRPLVLVRLGALFLLAAVLAGVFYTYGAARTLNRLVRGNSLVWLSVTPDDARLSASMRLALRDPTSAVTPGEFAWRSIASGFEAAELPVIAGGAEVDRISLVRVDPNRFRFLVRNRPSTDRVLDDWMTALGAALVINGSYFAHDGLPDTPFVSAGIQMGPRTYQAKHGAFVASAGSARIHDLANQDWRTVLRGADDAMVSYPLLVTSDGAARVTADRRWLANRSFVGQDGDGRIVLGTTADAFFSLERLAGFLRAAPLGLTLALNLDGGPVASQGITLNGFRRSTCGRYELSTRGDQLTLLTPLFLERARCWEMPIVLAVLPR